MKALNVIGLGAIFGCVIVLKYESLLSTRRLGLVTFILLVISVTGLVRDFGLESANIFPACQ